MAKKKEIDTMTTKKKGALSTDEMNYIRQNYIECTAEEMADKLNRTPAPIRKFIEKEGLISQDMTDREKAIIDLRSKYYYKEIVEQLEDNELRTFEQNWADVCIQFQLDVSATEESQVKEFIRVDILIDRCMKTQKANEAAIKEITELILAEKSKPQTEWDISYIQSLTTQKASYMAGKSAYVGEYEKLVNKKEKLLQQLKGTREQRKKNAEDAKTNFDSWLKLTQDNEFRAKLGFDIVVNAVAADKAEAKLAELHQYINNEVDQPLLSSETIMDEEEYE